MNPDVEKIDHLIDLLGALNQGDNLSVDAGVLSDEYLDLLEGIKDSMTPSPKNR